MNRKEVIEKRNRIVNAAIDLYVNNPETFTLKNIAKKARVKEAEIYSHFPNKAAILKDFYSGIVPQYKEMVKQIEGYELYDLSEKLSNFVYSSLDMMQEQRDFVEKTFNDFILHPHRKPDFQQQVESLVEEFMSEDNRIAASNQYLLNAFTYSLLSREYLFLVRFWIQDESPGSEQTMALTDKLTSFINEILYSAVLDKGFDLGRFLISNRVIRPNIPFWEACVDQFTGRRTWK